MATAVVPRPVQLVIEVVHSEGRRTNVEIREGDDPRSLAEAFVSKYGLEPEKINLLAMSIHESVRRHNMKQQGAQDAVLKKEDEDIDEDSDENSDEFSDNYATEDEEYSDEDIFEEDEHPETEAGEEHTRLMGAIARFRQKVEQDASDGQSATPRPPPPPPPAQQPATAMSQPHLGQGRGDKLPDPMDDTEAATPEDHEEVEPPVVHAAEQDTDTQLQDRAHEVEGSDYAASRSRASSKASAATSSGSQVSEAPGQGLATKETPDEEELRKALFHAPPPPDHFHVANPAPRGAANTRIASADERSRPPVLPPPPPPMSSTEENEDIYNRIRQHFQVKGRSVAEGQFELVEPPVAFARKLNGGPRAKKKKKARTKKRGAGGAGRARISRRQAAAFDRLHRDHERRSQMIERQRKLQEAAEVKYLETHSFKSLSKSSEMVSRKMTSGLSVGERLHEEGLKQRERVLGNIEERREQYEKEREVWTCPKCAYVNNVGQEFCRRVVGRTVPLERVRPSCWVHTDDGGTRRIHVEDELIFCGQPRPENDFTPTNVSSQSRKLISEWRRVDTVWHDLHENAFAEEKRRQLVQAVLEDENVELTLHPNIPSASRALVMERQLSAQDQRRDETQPAPEGGATIDMHTNGSLQPGGRSLDRNSWDGHPGKLFGNAALPERGSSDRNLELYALAKKKRAQIAAMEQDWVEQECSFHPDIGKSKFRPLAEGSQKEFVQRLMNEYVEREDRRRSLKNQLESNFDPETGAELFQPRIGRGPANRSTKEGNVHERMHKDAAEKTLQAHQREVDEMRKIQERSNSKFASRKSQVLVSRLRDNFFRDIFRTLLASVDFRLQQEDEGRSEPGEDGAAAPSAAGAAPDTPVDGAASGGNGRSSALWKDPKLWNTVALDTTRADPSLLAKPRLQDLARAALGRCNGRPVSFNTFRAYLEEVMADKTDPSGNFLAPTWQTNFEGIARQELEGCTFAPELDRHSRQLARAQGRDGSRPIEEVLLDEQSKYELLLQQNIEGRIVEETRECTFQPEITSRGKQMSQVQSYPLTRQYFPEDSGPTSQLEGSSEAADPRSLSAPTRPPSNDAPASQSIPGTVASSMRLTPHRGGSPTRTLGSTDSLRTSRQIVLDQLSGFGGDHSAPGAPNPMSPHQWHTQLRSPPTKEFVGATGNATATTPASVTRRVQTPTSSPRKRVFWKGGDAAEVEATTTVVLDGQQTAGGAGAGSSPQVQD